MINLQDYEPIRVGDRLLPGKFSTAHWFPVSIQAMAKIPEGGDRVMIGGYLELPFGLLLSWGDACRACAMETVLASVPGLTLSRESLDYQDQDWEDDESWYDA